jgi:hypothetical protein
MTSMFASHLPLLGRSTTIVGGVLLTLGGLYGQVFAESSPPVVPTVVATTTAITLSAGAPTAVPTAMLGGTPLPSTTAVGTPAPLPTAAPGTVAPLRTFQSESDLRVVLNRLLEEHTYLAGQAIALASFKGAGGFGMSQVQAARSGEPHSSLRAMSSWWSAASRRDGN